MSLSPYDGSTTDNLIATLIDLTRAVNSDPKKRPREDETMLASFDKAKRQKRVEMESRQKMAEQRLRARLAEQERKKKLKESE